MFKDPPAKKRFGGWTVSAGDVRFVNAKQMVQGYRIVLPQIGDDEVVSLSFFAVFEDDTYTVSFDCPDGAVDVPAAQTVFNGDRASEPSPSPSYAGCSFDGWYSDEGLSDKFDFSSPVTEDIELHSAWNAKVTTSAYNLAKGEGGSGGTVSAMGTDEAGSARIGTDITVKADPNPGYKFTRWALSDKDGTVVSHDVEYTFAIAEDISLVALFEGPDVTVHWSSIGGVNKTEPIIVSNVDPGTTISAALAGAGYDFLGSLFPDPSCRDSGYRTVKPLTEYRSYGELAAANISEDHPITVYPN